MAHYYTEFLDYHDIDDFIDKYNEVFVGSTELKGEELGLNHATGRYATLIYTGEKPTKDEINRLLEMHNVDPDDID